MERSLISYRKLVRCSIKIWELYKRCDISRRLWILWNIVYWWVRLYIIHYLHSI